MLTALATVEGRPLGVIANDPSHLGGAIDADGADKAARFLQLCDAFALPVLFLCDTPGFMVGPEAERTATVRHFSRLFVTGANLDDPDRHDRVLRKAYGLGAQAMAGGSFKAPLFTVGWPTSEFGGMGLEGAVRLGMRRELDAIDDPEERERVFEATVAAAYEHGRGVNMAAYGEIDDVIDPADSRRWIATLFDHPATAGWRERPPRSGVPTSTPGRPPGAGRGPAGLARALRPAAGVPTSTPGRPRGRPRIIAFGGGTACALRTRGRRPRAHTPRCATRPRGRSQKRSYNVEAAAT